MGSKKQTILILNGRRYDALTGAAVDSDGHAPAVRPISDVVGTRPSTPAVPVAPQAPAVAATPAQTASPKIMDVSRTTGHTKPHQTQRANTLVRSAVSKPKAGLKSQTKVSAPANTQIIQPTTSVMPKWPVNQVNPSRQNRAEQIQKSTVIQKFAPTDTISRPALAVTTAAPSPVSSPVAQPAQQSQDLFERAIAAAESHTQPAVDPKKLARQARKQAKDATKVRRQNPLRHHVASVVVASVAVLALGGFVGLQNKTALTLRFADAKAGFHAALPDYQPTGYSVGNFEYSAGNVGATFRNNASGREYNLSQQTTKWDNQTLLDNFVAVNYPSYQVLQSGQQIIYIYGKNDASWVKNGIWYQLTSNGSLSTSEVLNIATSV